MLYGFLIYYFGEPFATIRMAILGRANEYLFYFGKGDRLVGFDNKVFLFAYSLAALPILLLTLYKISRNNIYLVFIVITTIGMFLNGERAAFLSCLVVIIILIKKWFNAKRLIVMLVVFSVLFILFEYFIFEISTEEFVRIFTQKQMNEYLMRISRWVAGLLSIFQTPLVGSYIENYNSIFWQWWGEVPSSVHNTYINIGVFGGVIGWILFWIFGKNVIKLSKIMKVRMKNSYKSTVLYQGIIGAFIASLLVGVTHNNGIFNGEKTAIILLGFIVSGASLSISGTLSSNIAHK
jgi:hypothetical protein